MRHCPRHGLPSPTSSTVLALPSRVLLLAALLAATTGACGRGDDPAVTTTERSFAVHVARAEARDLEVALEAVGTAYASGQVDIRPQVTAVLLEAPFVEGDLVREGDVLIRLDDSKARASLALSQAQLDSARARQSVATVRLGRARRLMSENLVSREEFDTLDSEQKAAAASVRENEAEVRLAERNLADYTLVAPFDGRMGIRVVDTDNLVEAGTVISTLVDDDPLEVLFSIPAREVGELSVGQEVEVRSTEGQRALLASGRVRVIDARINTDTRMVAIKALVDNPDGRIRPGQFVAVRLVLETRAGAVAVPEDAVLPVAGKTYAYVVEDGRATRREVVLGLRRPGIVEVASGIRAGETIVTRGHHRLGEGGTVSVLEDQAGTGD